MKITTTAPSEKAAPGRQAGREKIRESSATQYYANPPRHLHGRVFPFCAPNSETFSREIVPGSHSASPATAYCSLAYAQSETETGECERIMVDINSVTTATPLLLSCSRNAAVRPRRVKREREKLQVRMRETRKCERVQTRHIESERELEREREQARDRERQRERE